MNWAVALLAGALVLGALPGAHGSGGCAAASAPPCGYITPIIDLQFPDKVKCPGAPGSVNLDECAKLMATGETVQFQGKVKWYWKMSEDLTYPADPQQPIVLSFSSTSSNPKYLSFKVEPSEFTIDSAALADPANQEIDQSNPTSPVVYYVFDPAITVTITRTGDPEGADAQRITDRDGLQNLFVKAKSTSSGQYFKESFGVEEFRFDARDALPSDSPLRTPSAGPTNEAAALPLVFSLLALLALAVRRK